jgi:hypothetical protein
MTSTAVTGHETASSAHSGNSVGILVQFTIYVHGDILDRHAGNIAFSHMHLLVNNRRKLVRHLLQELLVLQIVLVQFFQMQ